MSSTDTQEVQYVAAWLPCGIQNFDRSNGQFGALMFKTELPLLARFAQRYGQADVQLDDTRNLRFAWWPTPVTGTDWFYLDSDGFVFAIGQSPELPFLADPDFAVSRTGDQSPPWSDEWPLTAFQANLLFEGVWNSSFDPAVFMLTDRRRAATIEDSFRFGNLLKSIISQGVLAVPDPDRPLPAVVRGEVLERTVRSLRNDHLLPLKWNVEAARRRLFSETMTLLHRQENLHQFNASTIPNDVAEDSDSRDRLFVNTSDLQLRGYVSLVSAKLPLIDNMRYLMEDVLFSLGRDAELKKSSNDKVRIDITGQIVNSWVKLARALGENVAALEKSFETVWQASMFHEIEQVRIEEESLSELQREASHEREGKWFDTFLLAVTLGATVAVLVDAVNKSAEGGGTGPVEPPIEPAPSTGPTTGAAAESVAHVQDYIGLLIVIIGVCALLYLGSILVRRRFHGFIPRYEQVTRLDERFRNVVASRHINERTAPELLTTWDVATAHIPDWDAKPAGRRWSRVRTSREAFAKLGISASEDVAFGVLRRGEIQRARVDTPSDADTFLRLHLRFTFLLSTVRTGLRRLLPGSRIEPPVTGLHGLVNRALVRLTNTLPLRRAEVQLAVEFHKHWPDVSAPALLVLRETRAVVVSRKAVSLVESLALLHFVDVMLMSQLLPDYECASGQDPHRDRPVRLSIQTDRAMAYDSGDTIRFLGDPHSDHLLHGVDAQQDGISGEGHGESGEGRGDQCPGSIMS